LPSATRQKQEADRRCAKQRCQSLLPHQAGCERSWHPGSRAAWQKRLSPAVETEPTARSSSHLHGLVWFLPASLCQGHSCFLQGITRATAVYSHQLLCAPLFLMKCASLPAEFLLYVRDLGLHLSLAQSSLNITVTFVPQEGSLAVRCPEILSDVQRQRRGSGTSRSFRNWLLSKLWLAQSLLRAFSVGSVRRRASVGH